MDDKPRLMSVPTGPDTSIPETTIPKDLQDKMQALACLATTHNLLQDAPIPVFKHEAVRQCLAFLHELYESCAAECLAHPDAAKAPELTKLKEHREKVKNLEDVRELSKTKGEDAKDGKNSGEAGDHKADN